ncbi:hypothetical protein ACTXT7_005070 [Hymenolepis weldensis]
MDRQRRLLFCKSRWKGSNSLTSLTSTNHYQPGIPFITSSLDGLVVIDDKGQLSLSLSLSNMSPENVFLHIEHRYVCVVHCSGQRARSLNHKSRGRRSSVQISSD